MSYDLIKHKLVDSDTGKTLKKVLLNKAERDTLNYALALNGTNLKYLPLPKEKDAIR